MSIKTISQTRPVAETRRSTTTKRQRGTSSSLGRLASGLTVSANPAAAELPLVTDNLKAHERSLVASRRSASDGISLAQTAEHSLEPIRQHLEQMDELASRASEEDDSTDREALQKEFGDLRATIDRIAREADFDGIPILNGGRTELEVGTEDGDASRMELSFSDVTADALAPGLGEASLETSEDAEVAKGFVETAIEVSSRIDAEFTELRERLTVALDRLQTAEENLGASESRLNDAGRAAETTNNTRGQILLKAGVSMEAQASQLPGLAMSLVGSDS